MLPYRTKTRFVTDLKWCWPCTADRLRPDLTQTETKTYLLLFPVFSSSHKKTYITSVKVDQNTVLHVVGYNSFAAGYTHIIMMKLYPVLCKL